MEEISQKLGISISTIYRKIKKVKKISRYVRKKHVFMAYIVNPIKIRFY